MTQVGNGVGPVTFKAGLQVQRSEGDMTKSRIEWTDRIWNPTVGCSRVSPGCEHCYAERIAARNLSKSHSGLTVTGPNGPRWTGEVRLMHDRLEHPLRWRKPQRVFVDSMSDLFHPEVPDEFIDRVFAVMAIAGGKRARCFRRECDHEGFDCETAGASPTIQPIQTFQVLTKRPERMAEYLNSRGVHERILDATQSIGFTWESTVAESAGWPLRNVWLGTSCENAGTFHDRAWHLLQTPAALRFLSLEPLLSSIDLWAMRDGSWHDAEGATWYDALRGAAYWGDGTHGLGAGPAIDWVIVGGESGPGRRECDLNAIESIAEQCGRANVPCWVKQDSGPRAGLQGRIPDALWIKQFPEEARATS